MENGCDLQPLISVIIPVYNVAAYINRCLESVVNQRKQDLEIILIDDGSQDCSPAICDQWAQKDARIVVIHQANAGAAAARNRGLNVAKGQYIMFVDADDYMDKCIIQKLYDTLCGQECACCMCGYVSVNEHGQLYDPVVAFQAPAQLVVSYPERGYGSGGYVSCHRSTGGFSLAGAAGCNFPRL